MDPKTELILDAKDGLPYIKGTGPYAVIEIHQDDQFIIISDKSDKKAATDTFEIAAEIRPSHSTLGRLSKTPVFLELEF